MTFILCIAEQGCSEEEKKKWHDRWLPNGVEIDLGFKVHIISVVSGGLDQKTEYLDNFDLGLTLDADTLWGWSGATFYVYGLGNHGGDPSREHVGDSQGVSNIEAPDTWKLYEAWYQQNFYDDRLSLLTGLHDLNSEFDVIETAGIFLNSSHGIGPDFSQSGMNGPSIFSTTSLGARMRINPWENFYAQSAVYDGGAGDPDNPKGTQIILGKGEGVLVVGEMGIAGDDPYGKIAVGSWWYSAKFDDVSDVDSAGAPEKRRNFGVYGLGEYTFYREKNDPSQGLAGFVRVGMAREDVNQFDLYTGGGLVYTGLISGRDKDQFGVAVAVAHNGAGFESANAPVDDEEIVLEATYRFQVNPWLSVQPDIQYVINPGTVMGANDAIVVGAQVEMAL